MEPVYFVTEIEFRRWLEANHASAPDLLVGFWKKASGKPSIDWPQARDQALCFTPRRKGSIWSKVNVERFDALKAAGQMTPAGERAFDRKVRTGVYAYEKPFAELSPEEEAGFRANPNAWADWEKRPAGYRKVVLHWITSAKKPGTREKRLVTLIADSEAGRKIAGYGR